MVAEIQPPTRSQIAQLVGDDQRMILALEALFKSAGDLTPEQIAILTSRLDNVDAVSGPNVAAVGESVKRVARGFSSGGIVIASDKYDLPTAAAGVITLADDTAYWFQKTVDLLGDRLVLGRNTSIVGSASASARLKSTGLAGPLLTAPKTFQLDGITIEAALALSATASEASSCRWFDTNFEGTTVGVIDGFDNVLLDACALIDVGGFVIDGATETVALSGCLLQGNGTQATFSIADTAAISRRVRIVDTAVVTPLGATGASVQVGATVPDEGFRLINTNFSGAGTYLDGIASADRTAYFKDCIGIENTINLAEYYMSGNATPTVIATADVPVKVLGATTAGAIVQGFTHSDNRAAYDRGVTRTFKAVALASFTGGSGKDYTFYFAKNGAAIASSSAMVSSGTGGRTENVTIQSVISIADGDYIEVWISCASPIADATIDALHVILENVE